MGATHLSLPPIYEAQAQLLLPNFPAHSNLPYFIAMACQQNIIPLMIGGFHCKKNHEDTSGSYPIPRVAFEALGFGSSSAGVIEREIWCAEIIASLCSAHGLGGPDPLSLPPPTPATVIAVHARAHFMDQMLALGVLAYVQMLPCSPRLFFL